MDLIDIHAHLEHEKFKEDLDKVIENAKKAGVKIIINSGVNKKTNRDALELSEKYDIVKCSFGIYPIDALAKEMAELEASGFSRDIEELDVDKELKWIEKNKDKCLAIGEVGLDYNWEEIRNNEKAKEKQKEIFRKILKLAKKIDKPLIVHSRKAEEDAINILEEESFRNLQFTSANTNLPSKSFARFGINPPNHSENSTSKTFSQPKDGRSKLPESLKQSNPAVIMHCFSGRKSLILRGVKNGWFFSVPPIITRLQHFQTLVGLVPIEQLLTETDSPYLSPVAGGRNEPANVAVTIKEIAKIKGISKEEAGEKIWENAKRVFGFDFFDNNLN